MRSVFKAEAQKIADQINNASPDLSKEKTELASVTTQINNGVKALLTGMDFPELAEAVSKLRVRKSELEDLVLRADANQPKVNPQNIVDIFNDSVEHFAEDHEHMKEIVKQHVTKIYARLDGSFEVQMGVHVVVKVRQKRPAAARAACLSKRIPTVRELPTAGVQG